MARWFCEKCCHVVDAARYECCGRVVEFDPAKHGAQLVPLSNAWLGLQKWRDHALWRQVADDLAADGCCSASAVFNEFVRRLLVASRAE